MSAAWLIPAFPFAGFLILMFGKRMPGRLAGAIGTAAVGLSMATALTLSSLFVSSPPPGGSYSLTLWQWLSVGHFSSAVALSLDALSVVMILVVTVVGFLIHLFSVAHMAGEEGYSRFFAYMNLFVGSMLILVLADNLLLLYLGWEGVGLCSYLLIGFWYRDPANGRAARKAFIVTRIGDVSLLVGIFLIATSLGSLGIQEIAHRAVASWPRGSGMAVAAAALILGGALGKSAQLPLQTWLPDAMAGPSPVSALIHAATMVTAGVYLVARTNALFTLAPPVQLAVAVIGAATLFIAGASAITQRDIKRVLAYSTMSQIGYMFLALGIGAWTGAVFHLVTHAFFKSLLFLAAGVVINALNDEHDIFAMGGLAKKMPFTFWVFLIGAFGLTALPPVTAGFASKDAIVARAWTSGDPGHILWAVAMAGVFITSLYTFRLVFLVFGGQSRQSQAKSGEGHGGARLDAEAHNVAETRHYDLGMRAGPIMGTSLAILALLCLVGGLLDFPRTLGGLPLLSDFLGTAIPGPGEAGGSSLDGLLQALSLGLSLLGALLAWLLYRRAVRRSLRSGIETGRARDPALARFLRGGWGFDRVYALLFQRPFEWLARFNRSDVVNFLSEGVGAINMFFSKAFRRTQTGRIRWYVVFLAAGGVLVVAAAVIL